MEKERLVVKFEKDDGYVHPEFSKVKIWIATYGNNPNGSDIEKEAFEKAFDSLKNVPLVGEYSETIEDFKGHGGKIVIDDDGIKYVKTTKPYGVIPESCNPRWEKADDGVEYAVCDGIVWTGRYEESVKVLDNTCNQSMEIIVNDYSMENGVAKIKDFTFSGLCILGEDTAPCFKNAKITYSLDKDEFKKEFELLIEEVRKIDFSKGGQVVNREEIIAKFAHLKGEAFEAIIKNLDLTNEELETKLFALSVNDLEEKLREELRKYTYTYRYSWGETEECGKYYMRDVIPSEGICIARDYEKDFTVGIKYTIENDSITIDTENAQRYVRGDWRAYVEGDRVDDNLLFNQVSERAKEKIESLTSDFEAKTNELSDLETKYNTLNADFEKADAELKELQSFKADIMKQQRIIEEAELFEKFSELEGFEGYAELKEKANEFELETLETSLYALLGKKNFSAKSNKKSKPNTSVNIPIIPVGGENEELSPAEKRYGVGIRGYLNKK